MFLLLVVVRKCSESQPSLQVVYLKPSFHAHINALFILTPGITRTQFFVLRSTWHCHRFHVSVVYTKKRQSVVTYKAVCICMNRCCVCFRFNDFLTFCIWRMGAGFSRERWQATARRTDHDLPGLDRTDQ